jgi:hypothetical protein
VKIIYQGILCIEQPEMGCGKPVLPLQKETWERAKNSLSHHLEIS